MTQLLTVWVDHFSVGYNALAISDGEACPPGCSGIDYDLTGRYVCPRTDEIDPSPHVFPLKLNGTIDDGVIVQGLETGSELEICHDS